MTDKAPVPPKKTDGRFDDWLFRFWKYVNEVGGAAGGNVVINPALIDHSQLANLNSNNYAHLTEFEVQSLTGGNNTILHTHDALSNHEQLSGLLGGAVSGHYHLTSSQSDGLTSGSATALHKHDHAAQDNLNSTSYHHLTSTERSNLLGAQYLLLSNSASLTDDRAVAFSTGLSATDAGAGSTYTLNLDTFVGDSGTGGAEGGVPAPAAGDGTAEGNRKYLCADGTWRSPSFAGDTTHNILTGIQGGLVTGIFQTGVFQTGVFQIGVVEYYHINSSQYEDINRQYLVTTVSVDTTMTDSYGTYIVDTSAVTLTLPQANAARIGRTWTAVMDCTGYVDVAPDPTDEVILEGGSDTIRLDQIGSTLSMRCISPTKWVIA
jgi:hypothetical protein